jgi:FkbM family methyltransferase
MTTFNKVMLKLLGNGRNMAPQLCYGQDGEDLILNRLFRGKRTGLYIDVGAHHPMRFSNTYSFYLKGWRGINIDPEPGSMKLFKKYRDRDINLEVGIAAKAGHMTYYRFDDSALNTFDPQEAIKKNKPPYKLLECIDVKVCTLAEVLEMYIKKDQHIDFFTVDAEGMDEEVLRSNDWSRFRPKYILAETLRADLLDLSQSSLVQYLISQNYKPISKAYNTTFFELCGHERDSR